MRCLILLGVAVAAGWTGSSAAFATPPTTAIRYVYDADGHLKAVINPATETALYGWDPAGNLTSIALKSSTKLSIIQLAPVQGAVGETVTISGTGFSTTASSDTVKFNGTAATVSAATALSLTVKVPTGATSGTVTVQTTTEGPVTSSQTFTVASSAAPKVSSLSATIAAAGSEVTASGTNFETTFYNDVAAVNQTRPEVISESSTAIKFKVPAATGSGPVRVATPQGSSTGPDLYIPPSGIATSKVGPTGTFSLGTPITVKFPTKEKVALEVFEGAAGESVSMVLSESSIANGAVSIWTPEDTELSRTSFSTVRDFVSPATLPSTGTYTVLIEPTTGETGSVKLAAYSVVNQTGSISPTTEGASKEVSLTTPGDIGVFTVAGTAGESVSLKTSSTSFGNEFYIEWYNSEGTRLAYRGFGETENGLMEQVKFPSTGTYTLRVVPSEGATGSTTLTTYNASDVTGTLETGAPKTITISVPGQFARYTFAGTEGESVSMLLTESSIVNGAVSLWSPAGSQLSRKRFSTSREFISPMTLPATGTYTVLIEPTTGETGSVKLAAYSVVNQTGSISPTTEGASKGVSLTTPGDMGVFTVAGTAGEAVSLKTASTSFSGAFYVEWYNSEGTRLAYRAFGETENGFMEQVKFPSTGTYTLRVDPVEGATGSTTLIAYNASAVTGTITPTTSGETKTVTIGIPGQHAEYTFSGTEGHTVTITASESTIANGQMNILNPAGSNIGGSSFSTSKTASVEVTPATTGTYTIALEPNGEDTGRLTLTAYLGSHPEVIRGPSSGRSVSTPPQPTQPAAGDTMTASFAPDLPNVPTSNTTNKRGGTHLVPTRAVEPPARVQNAPRGAATFRPTGSGGWQPPMMGAHRGRGWETGYQASPWTNMPPLKALSGTTALAGEVLSIDGSPLAHIHMSIAGTTVATSTDDSGRFVLSGGVPAGQQILVVEDDSGRYGTYETSVNLAAHKMTILSYTIWLTRLDAAGDRRVASPTRQETTLTTPQIPGLEVRLPAGTVIHDAAGRVVRNLNVTAVPVDRTPFPLPFFADVPLYFTLQPGRAYLSKGAEIIYPNLGHLRPGSRVSFWNYDPHGRGWYIYGQGSVSPNGQQVVPDPGVRVWEFTGAMFSTTNPPPASGPTAGASPGGGDPVDLHTGLFDYHKTDLVLPDTIPIVIERTFRQGDTNSYSFGIGMQSLYDMHMWSNNNYHEADLVLPNGGKILYKRISAGEGFKEAEYKASTTPSIFYGSTIKWNESIPGWDLTLTNGITYVFGELAPLEAIRNRQGQQLTITRSEGLKGNITQITSPHGRWVKFTYNTSNDITEIKDNGGRTLKYAYNSGGTLEKVTDPAERTTTYEYNTSSQMTAIKDGRGKTYVESEYEAHGRVAKQTLGDGGVYKFAYTESKEGQVEAMTVTDPRKGEHKTTFNTEGFPTSETQALGTSIEQTTTYEPEAGTGLLLSTTDPRGRKTTFQYDSYGNMTKKTVLAGTSSAQTTEYKYEPGTTELASVTDPLKHTTTYHYGEHGELLSETDPLAHKTSFEYNPAGQVTVITNALGKTTKLTYEFGDLTAITDPLSRTTKQFIDALGRVGSTTTPGGQRTLYEYNPDDQVTKVTDPLGNVTSYEHDGDGDLTATTDPNKHKSTITYDPMDRLESETDPLEHTTKGVYDQDGNLIELTDRRGKLAKFTYDALNRLTEAKFGVSGETAESTIKYEYDNGNRLSKVVDSATGTYTPEYDELNRLKALATPNGTISYAYNEDNLRTSMTVPGQEAVKYTYDEANRLTELARGSQKIAFTYNEANFPTKTTLVDGVEEKYGYDAANEITSILDKKSSTTLGELDYSYNANSGREAVWGSYARTALPEAISSATNNSDDEQTERNGKKLSYDASGNLTSDGTDEYKWNARNQLTEITGGAKATFEYDPFGRRISKTIGGATTKVLYDEANAVQETKGSATANLLTGLSPDKTFARTTSSGTESLLTDALGSTIALAGSTGKAETSYTYDPFGSTTKEGTASENPFQYAGRESDGDGLYYDRARYLSPAGGRFISQDPLGQEANEPSGNVYLYTSDSPTNATDPYGTNLRFPTPGPGSGTSPGSSGSGGGAGGVGVGAGVGGAPGGGVGAVPGGFGPAPSSCANKGPGLVEAGRCKSYQRLEETEEEIRRDREEESNEAAREKLTPVGIACGAGGSATYMATRAASGGGEAAAAGATFCAGYTAGTLIVDPVLHKIAPEIFQEE